MTNTSETIVFFGNEKLATGIPAPHPVIRTAIEAAGFKVEKIVTGNLDELGEHTSQLAVLAAYGHIIPQAVLDRFPLGIINIHPSLLPEYRGSTPIETAILDGKTKTGVSIMRLEAGMDTGPIYRQKTVQLSGDESKIELTERLQKLGAELLVEVLPEIATGTLQPRNQSHPDRATYTRLLSKTDGFIDWSEPAELIERKIRAFLGWPGSRTALGSVEVIITQAHISDTETGLSMRCGDGKFLAIDALKPIGKKEMPVQAFLAGYRNKLKI